MEDLVVADKKTALPSSFPIVMIGRPDHQEWAHIELELRVGIGHELLDELRRAVGLHSYLLRRASNARGQEQMKNVSGQQKMASRKKTHVISEYVRNWARLSKLLSGSALTNAQREDALQGLRQLNSKSDAKYFEEWGSRTGEYVASGKHSVSWIWWVAMLENASTSAQKPGKSDIKSMTEEWESEGKNFSSFGEPLINL